MVRAFIAFVCAALLASAHAAELQGAWQGAWTKAGDPLAVVVTFTRAGGVYSGSFDCDALQRSGIPFSEVRQDGGKVRFVLQGDETRTVFDGALAGNVLSGSFDEGGVKGSFELVRAAPPSPLRGEEVTFANGGVMLAGSVILPVTPGRHPAIVFVHGSGDEGRWASRYFAEKFARAGFVALVFDKRGVGASTGDWRNAGIEELADDALAGIRLLAARADVDTARIGIYGHSQGASVAPLVAARNPALAFVIASAASGLDPAEVEIYSVGNFIGIPTMPPAERKDAERFVREIVAVAYHGKNRDALDAIAKEFRRRAWYFDPPPPEHHYWTHSRRIAAFRPLDHWRKVRAPVLLLFGAHDERVPPKESLAAIRGALEKAGNTKVETKVYPNANHIFTLVPQHPPGGWPKRVPDYADTLTSWAAALN